jgi:hypothetical protein
MDGDSDRVIDELVYKSAGLPKTTGDPNSANVYEMSEADRQAAGIELLPGNLLDAVRELERNDALRPGSASSATSTTSITSPRSSGASGRPPTSRSPSGSSTATCSCPRQPTQTARGPYMAFFKRKAKEPELRPCPRCGAMITRDALDCPSCGLDLREAYHPTADDSSSITQ